MFEVNYFGAVATTKAFLPLLRAHKGRIINVSSVAGLLATPLFGAYAASKYALEGLSDSLRKELRPLGVAVVLVNPAVVKTKIIGKIKSGIQATAWDAQWLALYGEAQAKLDKNFQRSEDMGDTTVVTDEAIVDAVVNSRPKARYFVANALGIPAVVLATLARVVPTYLLDWITLNL